MLNQLNYTKVKLTELDWGLQGLIVLLMILIQGYNPIYREDSNLTWLNLAVDAHLEEQRENCGSKFVRIQTSDYPISV